MTSTTSSASSTLGLPRWRGQRGRVEVWYATVTDERTGTGIWIHHETVAPRGEEAPFAHGWVALFPPDTEPVVERFGPAPVVAAGEGIWHEAAGCQLGDGRLQGHAGTLSWDLRYADSSAPLYTFPRTVWERELLPGAQVVPTPDAAFTGTIDVGGRPLAVDGSGAVARIYGHGSAQRWGWLHADLDGQGTLEIVTATARRAALRRLPPLALVQLRLPGRPDWPSSSLLAAPRFRTQLHPAGFEVRGGTRKTRLVVRVDLPSAGTVALRYTDPDGATATCRNSERASASIQLSDGGRERRWELDRVAHAEVGLRP